MLEPTGRRCSGHAVREEAIQSQIAVDFNTDKQKAGVKWL